MTVTDRMRLRVAGLDLSLEAGDGEVLLAAPSCHRRFLVQDERDGGLALRVRRARLPAVDRWRPLFRSWDVWSLWLDEDGRYVFVAPEASLPRRQVVVDTDFRAGEVLVADDGPGGAGALYPLQDIDMMVYAVWLAGQGDLIVHSAGVDDRGRGFCFVGPSGAGKSTLAGAYLRASSATVLGDDQVILRRLDGRFWIFGTPWHQNAERCHPRGVPLAKLFLLDRAAPPGSQACDPAKGVVRLMQNAFVPYYDLEGVSRILDTLGRLANQVPFFVLNYEIGSDIVEAVEGAGTVAS